MFKRIDVVQPEIEGYSYENKNGNIETVAVSSQFATITASGGQRADIWREDIPNLIKALQAAYDHKEA